MTWGKYMARSVGYLDNQWNYLIITVSSAHAYDWALPQILTSTDLGEARGLLSKVLNAKVQRTCWTLVLLICRKMNLRCNRVERVDHPCAEEGCLTTATCALTWISRGPVCRT